MDRLTLSFEEAIQILDVKDRAYAADLRVLISLLRKRRLNEHASVHERSAITIDENDRIADLYEKQAIRRAECYVLRAAIDSILHVSSGSDQQK